MTNVQNVSTAPRVTFLDALRVPEFRVMWLADAQSMVGDQLARVALSVLVFERTSSALLTALTYALTFLPALIGGAMLTGLADRFPRRRVMIVADVIRAVLLAGMAIPNTPLWLVCGLLVCVVLAGSPFSAAESALLPEILSGETFVVGTGLRTITNQMAQLGGFAFGGMAVAAIGARAGLAVDAATFAVSSVLISIGVHRRPSPAGGTGPSRGYLASIGAGAKLVAGSPRLRTLLGFSWLLGLYVVPEGVAPPYAHSLGAGSAGIGLLMAAGPAGTAIGTYSFLRWVPSASRAAWMPALAVLGGLPLVVCWLRPGIVVSIALWALSGAAAAYQVQVVTEYVRAVPASQRAQAVGVAASGLLAVQGVGILLGGLVAAQFSAATAVGMSGVAAAGLAMWFTLIWSKIPRQDSSTAPELADASDQASELADASQPAASQLADASDRTVRVSDPADRAPELADVPDRSVPASTLADIAGLTEVAGLGDAADVADELTAHRRRPSELPVASDRIGGARSSGSRSPLASQNAPAQPHGSLSPLN